MKSVSDGIKRYTLAGDVVSSILHFDILFHNAYYIQILTEMCGRRKNGTHALIVIWLLILVLILLTCRPGRAAAASYSQIVVMQDRVE